MGILAVDSIKSRTVAPVTITDDLNVTGVSTVGVLTVTSVVVGSGFTANADGAITSGIVTATTFSGAFSGTTGTFTGDLVGVAASFTGNVTVGGTLTYEDVTNVDSTGIVTAKGGVRVPNDTGTITLGTGGDLQLSHDGSDSYINQSGSGNLYIRGNGSNYIRIQPKTGEDGIRIIPDAEVQIYYDNTKRFETTTSGVTITGAGICTSLAVGPGIVQEDFHNYGTALTGTYNHDVVTHGMVLDSTVAASASFVINLRGDGSTTFNSLMNVGQTTVLTVYSVSSNASYYLTDFQIDGSSITEKWNGASAPSAGTGSGTDVYTFNIMKTASATFSVYANFSNFA